jgi:hypothetical protein
MGDPQKQTFSDVQPIQQTFTDVSPIDAQSQSPQDSKPSAAVRARDSFLQGIGVTDEESAKNFFRHPINTFMQSMEAQGQLAVKAKQAYEKGDYKGALMYGLNYMVPFIGQQTAKAGEQLNEGDYAGGIGRTLGVAAPLLAASPEARGAVSETASKASFPVKPLVGKAARVASDVIDPDLTGIVSPRLAHAQRALGRVADALEKSQQVHRTIESLGEPVFPGAPQPAASPELLQGNALLKGPQPVVDPAAGLGQIAPVRQPLPDAFNGPPSRYQPPVGTPENPFQKPAAPVPPRQPPPLPDAFNPAPPKATPPAGSVDNPFIGQRSWMQAIDELGPKTPVPDLKVRAAAIQQQLNDALGGRALQPNVPLRMQTPEGAIPKEPSAVPEGHTAVESSAVKSFKYDAGSNELHVKPVGGRTTYVYGDVSPEQAQAFAAADSKGTAWLDLRKSSSVPVAKIIDGKRIALRPVVKASDDLTSALEESLKQALAQK